MHKLQLQEVCNNSPSVPHTKSEKINLVRILSVIAVLFIHSNNTDQHYPSHNLTLDSSSIIYRLEYFFSYGLCEFAVPMLFTILGYLFFRSFDGSWRQYKQKISSRVFSIVIPYLIWSVTALAAFYTAQSLPLFSGLFTKQYLVPFSVQELFYYLVVKPIPSQLWFLSTAFAYLIFCHFFLLFRTSFSLPLFAILVTLWITGANHTLFEIRGAVFIALGTMISAEKVKLEAISKLGVFVPTTLWIVFSLIRSSVQLEPIFLSRAFQIGIVFSGIVAVWNLSDNLNSKLKSFLLSICPYGFFLYLAHEPLQGLLVKALFVVCQSNLMLHILAFFLTPVLTAAILLPIAKGIRSNFSRCYSVISGGR